MTVLCSGEIFIIGGRSKQKWLVTFENLDGDSSVNESVSQFLWKPGKCISAVIVVGR